MSFMENMKETLNEDFNYSVTENGALGYRTTGKEILDMNFSVASMRNKSENEIVEKFIKVFYENRLLAVKWLFYVRDCREGVGERRLFRICMKYLAENHADIVRAIIPLIGEYGRYDDLLCLLNIDEVKVDVLDFIDKQMLKDIKNMRNNKPCSLLLKWLPSPNTSSAEARRMAKFIYTNLGMSERQYRKTLSVVRAYLKVVETYMSSKRWNEIDYAAVPSRANLIYKDAFLRNDEVRRREYLDSLQKGETKINAGVLFPHDIVHKYMSNLYGWSYNVSGDVEPTLEELWKALPDYVNGSGNTICVADGSGSMTCCIDPNNRTTALDVANALAIYFAERSSGQFKDAYITFSNRPQIVDLSKGNSLKEKIEIALTHNEVSNTDIEKVFNLILKTAINKNMKQDELPQNILIISDMEFDYSVSGRCDKRLFETIAEKYVEHGYKLPRLVFWNVNSRTGTIPVKENDLGVTLVSGFSPAIVKMVLSNKTDPYECLLEQLNSERYQPVEDAVKDLIA